MVMPQEAVCMVCRVFGPDGHDLLALQSVKSMTTALGGIFEATAWRAPPGVAGVDTFGPVDPHAAALRARSVAGDVVPPGISLVKACGVLGGQRDSAVTGVRSVTLCSATRCSP